MDYSYNYNKRKTNNVKRKKTSNSKNVQYRAKHSNNKYKGRKLNKKKVFIVIAIPLLIIFCANKNSKKDKTIDTGASETQEETKTEQTGNTTSTNTEVTNSTKTTNTTTNNGSTTEKKVEITDWRLRLANYDNLLPEDFEVELADIDSSKQFDARAIKYLKNMVNDMKKAGNTNIWVQSAYRSVKRQKELYDNSINKYLKQGKSQEEAEKLTLEYINKPGGSDHNLGLAVDFNYVNNTFADTDEYKWLLKNAEKYGFVLRYPEDKEDVTKIAYESWHWRYVGEEHAKRMNELNMCLEEYVEYLEAGNT